MSWQSERDIARIGFVSVIELHCDEVDTSRRTVMAFIAEGKGNAEETEIWPDRRPKSGHENSHGRNTVEGQQRIHRLSGSCREVPAALVASN